MRKMMEINQEIIIINKNQKLDNIQANNINPQPNSEINCQIIKF